MIQHRRARIRAARAGVFILSVLLLCFFTPLVEAEGETYLVVFNSMGGSEVNSIPADFNATIPPPPDPIKAGFAFDGWYKSDSYAQIWIFDEDVVADNITLYAKWRDISCGNPIAVAQGSFTPCWMVAAKDLSAVYITGYDSNSSTSYLYRQDCVTNSILALPLPAATSNLYMTPDGQLVVSLINPASGKDMIAIVDHASFRIAHLFEVDMDMPIVRADSTYFYIGGFRTLSVYSRSNFTRISTLPFGSNIADLSVNPINGMLYVSNYNATESYRIVDGSPVLFGQNQVDRNGQMMVMPDGLHIVTSNGKVLSCGTTAETDLISKGYIDDNTTLKILSIDSNANELYCSLNRILYVYDASEFTFKRAITGAEIVKGLYCHEGKMVIGESNANGWTIYRTVYADALLATLKINSDAFSEFYPTKNLIDRGEVPYACASVNVSATAASPGAVVSGDTGVLPLSVGENLFHIEVTAPSGHTNTYTLRFVRRESDPAPVVYNAYTNLGFTPLDYIVDAPANIAYLTDGIGKSVYRVDLATGMITKKTLDLTAERMALANGKLYVTLPRHTHLSHFSRPDYGAVAVIDTASFSVERVIDIAIDPYDIEADITGRVYISPGSHPSPFSVYDTKTGLHLSDNSSMNWKSSISLNSVSGKLYAAQALCAYEFEDGIITAVYDAPDHADYHLNAAIVISPNGQTLYSGTGNYFLLSPTITGDMKYSGTIDAFTSLCFNIDGSRYYSVKDSVLTAYRAVDHLPMYHINIPATFDAISLVDTDLISLSHTGSVYFLNKYSADQNANLSALNLSAGTITPTFNNDTLEYSIVLAENADAVVIEPVLSDPQSTLKIDGVSAASKTVSLDKGGAATILIEVTAYGGSANKTYTLFLYRQTGDNTFYVNSDFFDPYDKTISADGAYIYMTGKGRHFVYRINTENGSVTVLPVPGDAKSLCWWKDKLYVKIENPAQSRFAVGTIDPASFMLEGMVEIGVATDVLCVDDNTFYVAIDDTLYFIDRFTGTSVHAHPVGVRDMRYSSVSGKLYIAYRDGVYSAQLNNDTIRLIQGCGGHDVNNLTILENGLYFVTSSGHVLTCSADDALDMQYMGLLDGNVCASADAITGSVYTVHDRVLYEYDTVTLAYRRALTENAYVTSILAANGKLSILTDDGCLRTINASALLKSLKIDGNAFSEFYPTHFDIDRGEVPLAQSEITIQAEAASDGAIVTGDIGTRALAVGQNTFSVTVTDPDSGRHETYQIFVNRRSSDPPETVYNAKTNIGFIPLDMVKDPDRQVLYLTAVNGNSLYRVDLATGAIEELKFDLKAEHIAIALGKIYVTLPRHIHFTPTRNNGYGAVAIVDAETFKIDKVFDVTLDPYGIETDGVGNVFIGGGSNQFTAMSVYNAAIGNRLSTINQVWEKSTLRYNSATGVLYTLSYFPPQIISYGYSNGVISTRIQNYLGAYSMKSGINISPDGDFVFNGSGNVFSSDASQSEDLEFIGYLGQPYDSICFDPTDDMFYTAKGKTLYVYDYSTRSLLRGYSFTESIIELVYGNPGVIALMQDSEGVYYIDDVDTTRDVIYTVTYDANGGTGLTENSSHTYDVPANLTLNGFTRSGYSFAGWALSQSGAVDYSDGASVANLINVGGVTVTLYAKWMPIVYSLAYQLNGGSVSSPNPDNYTIESADFTLLNPTRSGYRFMGWEGTGLESLQRSLTIGIGSTGNRVYSAIWEPLYSVNSESIYNISVTNGKLTPVFHYKTYNYLSAPDIGFSSCQYVITPYDPYAAITINGNPGRTVTLGTGSGQVNQAVIVVVSADGLKTKTYRISLAQRTNNANLANIDPLNDVMTPYFDPNITNYSISSNSNATYCNVQLTLQEPFATMTVNGIGNRTSVKMDLNNPTFPKTAIIIVTAPDGVTQKTYTITVSENSSNADLKTAYDYYNGSANQFSPQHDNQMADFYSRFTDFYIRPPYDQPSSFVRVVIDTLDQASTVTMNGIPLYRNGGSYFQGFAFEIGTVNNLPTKVVIVVTASDGITKKAYTFTYFNSALKLATPVIAATALDYRSSKISWNPIAHADRYEVYRSLYSGGPYLLIGTIPENEYVDSTAVTGKTNYYKVKAIGTPFTTTITSNLSAYKYVVSKWPEMTMSVSLIGSHSANLSWNTINGADGYQVWRSSSSSSSGYTLLKDSLTGTTYTDQTLDAGKTYYYKTRPYDIVDGSPVFGPYCTYKSIRPAWPIPTLFVSLSGSHSAALSWGAVAGADGYEVWRSSTSYSTRYNLLKDSVPGLSFVDRTMDAGKTYYYKVRPYVMVDELKVIGAFSAYRSQRSAWPVPVLTATLQGYHSAHLSWNAVSDADGYEVWRSTSSYSTGYLRIGGDISGTTFTDEFMEAGKTCYYKVRPYVMVDAVRVYGAFSLYKSAKAVWPPLLNFTVSRQGYHSASMTWSAVADASGYEVWRSVTSSSSGYAQISGEIIGTTYLDEKMIAGKTHYYKVRAYQSVDDAKAYGPFTTYKTSIPVWPTLTATAVAQNHRSILITWNAVAGATGYEVQRSTAYSGTYIPIATVEGSQSYTDSGSAGLTPNTTYYYKMRAYQLVGSEKVYGPLSSYKYAKTAWKTITLTAVSAGYDSIRLSWNAVSGAQGYELYRSFSSGSGYIKIFTGTLTDLAYLDIGLQAGRTHYYKVRAVDTVNGTTVWGPYSAYKYIKPVPAVPTGITLSNAGTRSILISWDAVPGATGYEVYRSTSATGTYTLLRTGAELNFTNNTGLTSGMRYYYKVRAYAMYGTTKVVGLYTAPSSISAT